jgi:hypothetical protein
MPLRFCQTRDLNILWDILFIIIIKRIYCSAKREISQGRQAKNQDKFCKTKSDNYLFAFCLFPSPWRERAYTQVSDRLR